MTLNRINKKIKYHLENSETYEEFYEKAEEIIRRKLQVYIEKEIEDEACHLWDEYCYDTNPLEPPQKP